MLERGFDVGFIKQIQATWWHLHECAPCERVHAMVHHAESPSEARRCLNYYRFLLYDMSDPERNLHEHKMANLQMKHGEDPHVCFSEVKEALGAPLMLGLV